MLFCIVLIVLCVCVLPIKTIIVYLAFQYHLATLGLDDDYKQGNITYHEVEGFNHSGYTMKMKGKGIDDEFHITWDYSGIYDTYQNVVVNKEHMEYRLKEAYREEVQSFVDEYMLSEETIYFDFGGNEGTLWMREHIQQNTPYHKNLFVGLQQRYSVCFKERYDMDEIVATLIEIQRTLDQNGFEASLYNIQLDQGGQHHVFLNLSRNDINADLANRFHALMNHTTTDSIQYDVQFYE